MPAYASSAENEFLPASIDSVMLRPPRGRRAWWFPVICCVISVMATAIFVERLHREAWQAAEHDLAMVAGIAAEDAASVSERVGIAQSGNGQSENEPQSKQHLIQLSERFLRLTGKQVVWIDPRSKQLVSSEHHGFGESVGPALATALAATAGSAFNLRIESDAAPFMVVTRSLSASRPDAMMVAVLARESEMLASFYRLRRDAVTACLGFMLTVWILAWAFSRHLLRREAKETALLNVENTSNAERMHLKETNRIAQLGHFYWNLATDALDLHGDGNSLYGYIPSQYFRTMREWEEKFCPADDREAVAANRKWHIEQGEAYTVQRRTNTPAGEMRWLDVAAEPVRDESGNLIAYRGVFRDITAQKSAEFQLKESEEKFRLISENMHEQVVLFATNGVIIYASPSTTTLLGYDAKTSIGKSPYKNVHPQDVVRVRSAVDALAATIGALPTAIEYRYRHRDGHYLWLQTAIVPVRDAHGVPIYFQASARDITRIKTNERRLAESEERYRLITQNMHDLISLHDNRGKLLYVSPSFYTITGHDIPAMVGVSPRYLLHPDDVDWVQKRYVQLAAGEVVPPRLTYRLRHRLGHYLCLESQVTPVQAPDGSLLHMQIVSRDVSARREAEIEVQKKTRELAKANKLLAAEVRERQELEREILTAIELELAQVGLELHDELGQDLTGIALLTKSLERRLIEKGLNEAGDATRILQVVNRTIGHTRMISHGLSPYIWGTDGLVAALAQLASDTSSLGVVECETFLDGNVCIDDEVVARSLYRIAQESINNALKHSGAQRLTLSLNKLDKGVELTIKDNGIGHPNPTEPVGALGRFHSIRHRCSAINAVLTVRHGEPGGTVVTVVWQPRANLSAGQIHADGVLQ